MNAFTFFFAIFAAVLPTAIASYAIVGEKMEKSLEPLLATPTTDREILLGKSIAAILPPLASIYVGATIFMALSDYITAGALGYLYFPNWSAAGILLILVPCVEVFSVELNVIISSRVSDVRTASQLGTLVVLPLAAVYVGSELGLVDLSSTNVLLISALFLVLDLALFSLSSRTFQREEILTRWK